MTGLENKLPNPPKTHEEAEWDNTDNPNMHSEGYLLRIFVVGKYWLLAVSSYRSSVFADTSKLCVCVCEGIAVCPAETIS